MDFRLLRSVTHHEHSRVVQKLAAPSVEGKEGVRRSRASAPGDHEMIEDAHDDDLQIQNIVAMDMMQSRGCAVGV